MKKIVLVFVAVMSGIMITLVFGMTLLMRRLSLYQMNHIRPAMQR